MFTVLEQFLQKQAHPSRHKNPLSPCSSASSCQVAAHPEAPTLSARARRAAAASLVGPLGADFEAREMGERGGKMLRVGQPGLGHSLSDCNLRQEDA